MMTTAYDDYRRPLTVSGEPAGTAERLAAGASWSCSPGRWKRCGVIRPAAECVQHGFCISERRACALFGIVVTASLRCVSDSTCEEKRLGCVIRRYCTSFELGVRPATHARHRRRVLINPLGRDVPGGAGQCEIGPVPADACNLSGHGKSAGTGRFWACMSWICVGRRQIMPGFATILWFGH